MRAQEAPPENDAVPLLTLLKLYASEWLEQQAFKLGHPKAGGVDESVVLSTDATDLALVRDRQLQLARELIIDAVSARAGVDEGLDTFEG
jgi:hypothetical protein